MFRFLYYDNHTDTQPTILHDVDSENQILTGKMNVIQNGVTQVTFSIGLNNDLYMRLKPIVGLVKIVNTLDNSQVFFGRVLKPINEMTRKGLYREEYVLEDFMSYFKDTQQPYMKITNNGPRDFIEKIIANHNSRCESHKRFKVGYVTVITETDLLFRYIGYQSTFETLSEHVISKIGGYIKIRHTPDGLYIDWLAEPGVYVNSPIEAGENIKFAKREGVFDEIITRLVPLGADVEVDDIKDDAEAIRERLGIAVVNNGLNYIQDDELIKEFGIRENSVDWPEIDDEHILLDRGQQYMEGQKLILSTWTVEVVDKSLIDSRFQKFEVGNTHPILNAPMSGIEKLQITEMEIDFLNPQRINLDVGADKQTLSRYFLQMQEAQKSIQKVRRESNMIKSQLQQQLAILQGQIGNLLGVEGNEGLIAQLQQQIQEILEQLEGGA